MIHVYLYGFLKKKFDSNAKLSESTMIEFENKTNESFEDFLKRINVSKSELGDCFINGKVAQYNNIIPQDARIGLFGLGMCLLDGGQHIKGHGYVTKPAPVPINTWNLS